MFVIAISFSFYGHFLKPTDSMLFEYGDKFTPPLKFTYYAASYHNTEIAM